eukprot:7616419-Pyramimonas_sp.AAC.1
MQGGGLEERVGWRQRVGNQIVGDFWNALVLRPIRCHLRVGPPTSCRGAVALVPDPWCPSRSVTPSRCPRSLTQRGWECARGEETPRSGAELPGLPLPECVSGCVFVLLRASPV